MLSPGVESVGLTDAVLMIAPVALPFTVPVTVKITSPPPFRLNVPVVKLPLVFEPLAGHVAPRPALQLQLNPEEEKSEVVHLSLIVTPVAVDEPLLKTVMLKLKPLLFV